MRRTAWIYIFAVMFSAGALSVVAFVYRPQDNPPVWLFVCLTVAAALQRIFRIVAPGNKVYESSTISFFAGVLLLPPWLFVIMVVIAHALEWARERLIHSNNLCAWYIQPFNMAKCIIAGTAAYTITILSPAEVWAPSSSGYLIVVAISAVTYVVLNQLLLGMALLLARGVSFREAGIWRDAVLMEVPLACIGYVTAELMHRSPLAALFVLAPMALIYQAFMLPKTQDEAMKALENVNRDLTDANQSIHELNDELFLTLAKIFDARDPYVGGHAAQVATYAMAIATEMNLPPEQIEVIRQSAYLHDIGKIAIPEAILHKPDRLTAAEYEIVKQHVDYGAEFITTNRGLRHLAPFVRHHHERWDGGGYPSGLAGEAIPLEARILNVCDSIEAMASDRPYHRALSVSQIIAELERCAGSQFDPAVVEAFTRLTEREGADLVVNSARTVARQRAEIDLASRGLSVDVFKPIYSIAST
jgi:putative nucleotidyltransferase with HDIG domain